MRLKDKVVIITGGGSGMGKAASELFAEEGAKVIIADYEEVYKRPVGKETADALVEKGYEVTYIETDVSDEKAVEALVKKTISKYGRIDVLYNNASHGYSSPYVMADLMHTPTFDWNKVISLNLTSVYLCCKYVIPYMIKEKCGSIINCSSINALVSMPGADAYTAAKGGVVALTRVLATDLAPYNIRVNCICPGAILTPMIAGAFEGPEVMKTVEASVPLGRLGKPEEIAYTALFLASNEASYITGCVIPVDGGWTTR
jgi:NAD(P)-dependent dehydrogenase (short-subunit alcohol dehydrogenase family)